MEFGSSASGHAGTVAEIEVGDLSGVDTADVIKLILQTDSVRRKAEGQLAALLVRLAELEGDEAVDAVCSQFGVRGYKSRRQAKVAKGLRALPDVLLAAKDGWITMDHAELMAESHGRAPMSGDQQLELLVSAIKQDSDQFKKTVAVSEQERMSVDGLGRTERQRARRCAKVFDGDDDMVILHAELDQIAGERVKTALAAMNTRILKSEPAGEHGRTFEQRNADALVALITQEPASNPSGNDGASDNDSASSQEETPGQDAGVRPQKTTLVVCADYDAITGKLQDAGLIDGTPIELDELRRLACDAEIIPMIFGADGHPMYVGRSQRTATRAQKIALFRRDQGCASCGLRPDACDAHHVVPWEQGGRTDIDNLVLLCPRCPRQSPQARTHCR